MVVFASDRQVLGNLRRQAPVARAEVWLWGKSGGEWRRMDLNG